VAERHGLDANGLEVPVEIVTTRPYDPPDGQPSQLACVERPAGVSVLPSTPRAASSGKGGTMRIEFTPDRSLYPFESRWFDSSRGRMHYIDEGAGPAILFCHGNPTWSFLYRHIVVALRDRFLAVEEYVVMGQDWGGPIGMAVSVERADRVRGVVLGNTWFWPAESLSMKTFSRVMSSGPLQRRILDRNFFVERLMPSGMASTLTPQEMDHYREVQPSPEARRGVAEMPRQILAARLLLERLARQVPERLGDTPALLVWGMRDMGFRPKAFLPRMRATFPDHEVVELPRAKHYIQEDAPEEIAAAILGRFGP
jgi:haloalkane dehalogenase